MANLAFLADDLTGALDAGVQLLDFGYTVSVCLAHGDLTAETADILVLDSESRNILPAAAAEQVRRGLALLQAAGRHLVYKKIDSTLRGNIGSELAALLDATWCDGILIAPALPAQGRTTRDGIHFVQGLPLAQTELARDPFAPILSSRIAEIIASQSDRPTAEIPLAYVRGPAPA
ncbi:MAG: four-carbon acid sugar kinase family protein, partial [Clostridiaceae bacterium]|nr:four-carbon acid sugar kinase family protein [Clostridiaceae bacterium]